MTEKISELLEGKVLPQSKLAYPNLNTVGDHPLFLDPILILGESDRSTFAKKCWVTLDDYFSSLFKEIEDGTLNITSPILQNLREKNSFRLGYSQNSPQGKGCSPEMVYKLLTRVGLPQLKKLLEQGIIASPMDIALYVKDFSEDRLSDLISNVLFKHFVEYTNDIAAKSSNANKLNYSDETGVTWDEKSHSWVEFTYKQLLDSNDKPVILVSKRLVTDKYQYSARRFFQGIMLAHLQEEEKKKLNLEKLPSKKSIRKALDKKLGKFYKKHFITDYILRNGEISLASKFRKDSINGAKGSQYSGFLTDHELDKIINGKDDDKTA